MYEAVIFDMDGVLVDSEPLHMEAWHEVLTRQGVDVAPSVLARGIGVSDEDFSRRLRSDLLIAETAAQLLAQKRAAYLVLARESVQLLPGALALVDALSHRCRLGLATSSPRAEAELMLDRFELRPYFQSVCSGDDVPRVKPFPDCFLLSAHQLGVTPSQCVALEDSPTGVQAAKAAGIPVVAIASTHDRPSLSAADIVVTALEPTGRMLDAIATVCCDVYH